MGECESVLMLPSANASASRQTLFRRVLNELYKPKAQRPQGAQRAQCLGPGSSPALIASVLAAVRSSLSGESFASSLSSFY